MKKISAALLAVLVLAPAAAMAGSGSFTGASGHVTTGGVEVVQTATGWEIRLGADFSLDGAPDPRVGFGKGGKFADGTDFEVLRQNKGAQTYAVPAGIDAASFDEVYIWCRKYSVPLGVAKVN
ncbi:MAG TPA: DM13 domain-containing protein [Thermohalobaculum sp.]|nr:DM13 domain-containing protein [Thermohalobaculum sp.]